MAELVEGGNGRTEPPAVDGDLAAKVEAAMSVEAPTGRQCLELARAYLRAGDERSAATWLLRIVDDKSSFLPWQSGAALLPSIAGALHGPSRSARVAFLGTFTTAQLVPMVVLAARRFDIEITSFEGQFAQHEQAILDPKSDLYRFDPDYVVLVTHADATQLPEMTDDPAAAIEAEVGRWTALWRLARERSGARIVQQLFAVRPDSALGHFGIRSPGSRDSLLHALNRRLAEEAGDDVVIIDCERLASFVGKRYWFDDRYWHLAKQAVALNALPLLAKHTAAVIAADLGLTRKCIVLDLDNTLWGGVIGEDGLEGIRIGGDAEGEAYQEFQRFLLAQKRKGILLAVCSKNNPDDARLPFEDHPDMILTLDDFAAFEAGWDPKPDVVSRIADELGIGLDSLVYIDDNPAEREVIRSELEAVDVVVLPDDPAGYVRALAEYPLLEITRVTEDDERRTELYRARVKTRQVQSATTDLPTFWRSLDMRAQIAPVDQLHLPRVVQLIAKTNQFNLTTRRHGAATVQEMTDSPDWITAYATLEDRFAHHGVVAVALAHHDGATVRIDTLLMSCRVIGRTLESALLAYLSDVAVALGATRLRGEMIPTAKNSPARDFYADHGFTLVEETAHGVCDWEYDLGRDGPINSEYVIIETP